MQRHFIFKSSPDGKLLECRFPNFLTHDIFFLVSGFFLNDKKTVAISSLQISSRPVFIKKGCFNLLKKEECECKTLHKFLQNGGVQAHLEEDIVINHCSHKHIVSSDAKLATKFTYDFQRKTGDKNSVLLKIEQFGSLIFKIFHGGESFSGLSREQSDLFEYLRNV